MNRGLSGYNTDWALPVFEQVWKCVRSVPFTSWTRTRYSQGGMKRGLVSSSSPFGLVQMMHAFFHHPSMFLCNGSKRIWLKWSKWSSRLIQNITHPAPGWSSWLLPPSTHIRGLPICNRVIRHWRWIDCLRQQKNMLTQSGKLARNTTLAKWMSGIYFGMQPAIKRSP